MALADAGTRVLLCVSLVALGSTARALQWVKPADGGALLRVIFGITLPAVLLTTFSNAPLDLAGAGLVVACSVAHACLLALLSFTWEHPQRSAQQVALLSGASFGVNLGLFAYPFAAALFGEHGLKVIVLYDLFNQGVLLVLQYLAFWWRCAPGGTSGGAGAPAAVAAVAKRLFTPCLLALYAATILAVTRTSISPAVQAVTSQLVAANAPLTLLALGVLLDTRVPGRALVDVAALLGARYGVSLAFGAGCVLLLQPLVPIETVAAVLLAATSPVPMLTVTYSEQFGCDTSLAAIIINASMVLSFLSLVTVLHISQTAPASLAPVAAACAAACLLVALLGRWQQHRHLREQRGPVVAMLLHGRQQSNAQQAKPSAGAFKLTRRLIGGTMMHVEQHRGGVAVVRSMRLAGIRQAARAHCLRKRRPAASHPVAHMLMRALPCC
jgi:predicted permease